MDQSSVVYILTFIRIISIVKSQFILKLHGHGSNLLVKGITNL